MLFNVAAIASLLGVASARIASIGVPDTVLPGIRVPIVIKTSLYIQAVYDVSLAVGIAPGAGYPQSLGTVINSFYLGPDESNVPADITRYITIPSDTAKGTALISASLTSLVGALAMPVIENFNVSITVGDFTSTNIKYSSA